MEILEIKTLPNGDEELSIELTDEERELIKKAKGWKKLTNKRIQEWFLETLMNTTLKEDEKNEEYEKDEKN
jgi:hypothetical protein